MRVISGKHKRCERIGYNIDGVRPTMDKVRESIFAMINPKLTKTEGVCLFKEGCLSAPNVSKTVQRARRVTVEYLNEQGEKVRATRGGLTAIIIQHELSHFDGWCEVFDAIEENN